MSSSLRRYEILLPLQFNDGTEIPADFLSEAIFEAVDKFGAVSYYHGIVQGQWTHEGTIYRDQNSKLVIDVADTDENRQWMRDFKAHWKEQLGQLDLWVVSFLINAEQ